jgi:hypothetical protein
VPYDLAAVIRSYGLRRRSVDEDGRPTRVSFAPVLSGDLRPQSLDQSRFGDISSCEASLKWALEESILSMDVSVLDNVTKDSTFKVDESVVSNDDAEVRSESTDSSEDDEIAVEPKTPSRRGETQASAASPARAGPPVMPRDLSLGARTKWRAHDKACSKSRLDILMKNCSMNLDQLFHEGCRLQVHPTVQRLKKGEDTDNPTAELIDAAVAKGVASSPRTFTEKGSARSDDWATWFVRYIWEPHLSRPTAGYMMVCQGHVLTSLLKHGVISKSTVETLAKKEALALDPDNPDEERVSEFIRGSKSKSSQRETLAPFEKRSPELFCEMCKVPTTTEEKRWLFTKEKVLAMPPGSPRVTLFEHILEEASAFYNDSPHRNFWEHGMYLDLEEMTAIRSSPSNRIEVKDEWLREEGGPTNFSVELMRFYTKAVVKPDWTAMIYFCLFSMHSKTAYKLYSHTADDEWMSGKRETSATRSDFEHFVDRWEARHEKLREQGELEGGESQQAAYSKVARKQTGLGGGTPRGRARTGAQPSSWIAGSVATIRSKAGKKWHNRAANTGKVVSAPYFDQVRRAHVSDPNGADGMAYAELLEGRASIRVVSAGSSKTGDPNVQHGTIDSYLEEEGARVSTHESQTDEPWNCTDLPGPFASGDEELYKYCGGVSNLVARRIQAKPSDVADTGAMEKYLTGIVGRRQHDENVTNLTQSNIVKLHSKAKRAPTAGNLPSAKAAKWPITKAVTAGPCPGCDKTIWGKTFNERKGCTNSESHAKETCVHEDFLVLFGPDLAKALPPHIASTIMYHLYPARHLAPYGNNESRNRDLKATIERFHQEKKRTGRD